jgi:hypothetical protein
MNACTTNERAPEAGVLEPFPEQGWKRQQVQREGEKERTQRRGTVIVLRMGYTADQSE